MVAKSLTHKFTSAVGDGTDATLVRPSSWNDDHNFLYGYRSVTTATDTIVATDTHSLITYNSGVAVAVSVAPLPAGFRGAVRNVGAGVVTITGTSGATINGAASLALNQNDAADLYSSGANDIAAVTHLAPIAAAAAWTTGDAKLTIKTVADVGWILMDDGTIGDASSGASNRANADCQNLFVLLWNNITDTYAPVVGGRGTNAATDWAAHKKITLTRQCGRALIIHGAGAGLTSRALGEYGGEEKHTQVAGELVSHNHIAQTTYPYPYQQAQTGGGTDQSWIVPVTYGASPQTGVSVTVFGSGTPFNVMQPYAGWNIMMKL